MSKLDWKKIRPILLNQLRHGTRGYVIESLVPVALDVLRTRSFLIRCVSKLLNFVPVKACRHCPEVHVGHIGHSMQTCRYGREQSPHIWIDGSVNDIIVPRECFHLNHRFQSVIEHAERSEFTRIPAVVELCLQAGAETRDLHARKQKSFIDLIPDKFFEGEIYQREELWNAKNTTRQYSPEVMGELSALAQKTLQAWETFRQGTKELMHAYPAKVCRFCAEVHVGPVGHRVRSCATNSRKPGSSTRQHTWKLANVDDLIPPRYVWHERKHDKIPLTNEGRGYYGHAPAVVELCAQNGAIISTDYHCRMKVNGLSP